MAINLKQFGATNQVPASPVAPHPTTQGQEGQVSPSTTPAHPRTESEASSPASQPKPAAGGIKLGALKLGTPTATPASTPVEAKPSSLATKLPAVVQKEAVPEVSSAPVEGPEGFQELLDRLDSLIGADQGISDLTIDTVRGYVGKIMVDLKTNPEYDPLLKDRDVHNIMSFVQRTTQTATTTLMKAKERKLVKAANKINTDFGLDNFDTIAIPGPTQKAVAAAKSVQAFAGLDFDSIEVKTSKGRG